MKMSVIALAASIIVYGIAFVCICVYAAYGTPALIWAALVMFSISAVIAFSSLVFLALGK